MITNQKTTVLIRKFIILTSMLLFVLLGCKKQGEQVEEPSSKSISLDHRITANDIEQLNYTEFALSDLAEDATRDWLKFQELQTQIDILKKGDLSFFKDDKAILVSLLTDLKNEMPEAVNDQGCPPWTGQKTMHCCWPSTE
jgi:hypothetical protein